MTSQNVEVKLELGHKASIRRDVTPEGYTHDWTLFVRGSEGCHIQHYVEKVVFFLHESFPKPKRVLKEPPYHVEECGYAGFNLSIEVHFRNKEDPKKVCFDYDLYLHLEGPPIHNFRLEKLTFQNPNQEFRKKLLKGGGVAISGGNQSSNSNPVHTETEQAPKSKSIRSTSNEGPKKTPKVKLPHTAKEVPSKIPEPPQLPFTQIFGAPIKTKPSPDTSHKSKDITKEKSSSNSSSSSKTTVAPTPPTKEPPLAPSSTSSSSLQNSSTKFTSKDSHKTSSSSKEKVSKGVCKETEKKEIKSNSDSKSSTHKRSSSPPSQGHKAESSAIKKRKRSTSTSSATSSVAEKNGYVKEKKAKPPKEPKKEHKLAPTLPAVVPPKKETQKHTKPSQVVARKGPRELKSPVIPVNNNDQDSRLSSGKPKVDAENSDSSSSSSDEKDEKDIKPEEGESRSSVGTASSPASSLTLSSITPGSAHGPLATMMAQMEQELLSPLSSDQASPAHSVTSPKPPLPEEPSPSPPHSPLTPPTPVKVEEPPSKKSKEKRQSEKHTSSSKKSKDDTGNCLPPPLPSQLKSDGKPQPIDAAYLHELMQLQEQIMSLRDKQHLQRIVDVIEETGLYQITSSTIDFDLCALDRSTVQKLQNCMTVT